MIQSSTVPRPALRRPLPPVIYAWVVAAIAGWAGIVALGIRLWSAVPRQAGFDLELLLVAGRRVAAGSSPYEPSMLAGTPPTAVDLFYSYPPPVAQYLALFAAVPSGLMLMTWAFVAVAGLLATGVLFSRVVDRPVGREDRTLATGLLVPLLGVAAFVSPFAIALLFGNLDAAFPLLYGLMLVAALAGSTSGRFVPAARFAGGTSLAIASIAKVHPSPMALWFLVRGLRERRNRVEPNAWFVLAAAVAVGLVIVAFSLIVGGLGPWQDWATVIRVGAASPIVDFRNIGPASQLGLLLGGGEDVARAAQVVVSIGAIALTAWSAWTRDDPVEGFALATVASLVVLPITWVHYPVALLPVAIVAALRAPSGAPSRRVLSLLGAAVAISILAVVVPAIVWVSVGLVLLAVRSAAPTSPSIPAARATFTPPAPAPGPNASTSSS